MEKIDQKRSVEELDEFVCEMKGAGISEIDKANWELLYNNEHFYTLYKKIVDVVDIVAIEIDNVEQEFAELKKQHMKSSKDLIRMNEREQNPWYNHNHPVYKGSMSIPEIYKAYSKLVGEVEQYEKALGKLRKENGDVQRKCFNLVKGIANTLQNAGQHKGNKESVLKLREEYMAQMEQFQTFASEVSEGKESTLDKLTQLHQAIEEAREQEKKVNSQTLAKIFDQGKSIMDTFQTVDTYGAMLLGGTTIRSTLKTIDSKNKIQNRSKVLKSK